MIYNAKILKILISNTLTTKNMLRLCFVSVRYADETMQSQHPPLSSVVQSTELPSS